MISKILCDKDDCQILCGNSKTIINIPHTNMQIPLVCFACTHFIKIDIYAEVNQGVAKKMLAGDDTSNRIVFGNNVSIASPIDAINGVTHPLNMQIDIKPWKYLYVARL